MHTWMNEWMKIKSSKQLLLRATVIKTRFLLWLRQYRIGCTMGGPGSSPGLGRSPGEGDGYPLKYSCLENSRDRGVWRATVHKVGQNWVTNTHIHMIKTMVNSIYLLIIKYLLSTCFVSGTVRPWRHEGKRKDTIAALLWYEYNPVQDTEDYVYLLSRYSHVRLCDPMDCSPAGSSVHGILQTRILEWVTIFFSRGSSQPRDRTWVFHIADRFFSIRATREAPSAE